MSPLRSAVAVLVIALLALGAYVMARGVDPAAGLATGHVYTGCADEPPDVNPFTAMRSSARKLVLARTHDTLLQLDARTGALEPALASSYEIAADGASCTFTLRAGVRFADGAPVTMADVLFGWELRQNARLVLWNVSDAFERVAHAEAIDDKRLRVQFRGAHYAACEAVGCNWIVAQRAFLLDRVRAKLPAGSELPPIASEAFAEAFGCVTQECGPGTGPYVLHNDATTRNWIPHESLLLVRNEHCWRRQLDPHVWTFAGIRVLFRSSPEAATNAVLRGEVDWHSGPNARDLHGRPAVASAYEFLTYGYRTLGVFRVVWNCRHAPFADVRVRVALSGLFDRAAITQALGGEADPAVAHAVRGEPGHPDDLVAATFDPAAVRRALREAGHDPAAGTGLSLRLLAPVGTDALRRIVDTMKASCQAAGIALETRQLESGAYEAALKAGDWDGLLALQGFRPWGDPYDLLHSGGLLNFGGFADAEIDAELAVAQAESDPMLRAAVWQRVHRRVHALQPAALLVQPRVTLLLSRHVQDAHIGPLGLDLEHAFVPARYQRR